MRNAIASGTDSMENINKSILTVNDPENLHLCFVLDNNTYALNAKYVLEVTTLPLINDPQKLPEYIVGILNYNDLFINVVDIRKVFALPQKKYELTNKVIIIKGEESLIAIIVDEVTDFFTAVPAQIQRVMGENFNNIVKTFYKLEEDVVNIINIEQLEETIKKVHFEENTTNYSELFPNDEESVCILQKRRNDIAQLPQMNLEMDIFGKDQYVIFKLGKHTYCIYSLFVKELISPKNYNITKIPYTPDFVSGIINLKGNFYTVIDLKKFIGFKDDTAVKDDNAKSEEQVTKREELFDNKIIVVESSELKLALQVDDIANIINISQENIEAKNEIMLDNMYIQAEAYIDEKVYNILNVEKLINDERLYVDNSN